MARILYSVQGDGLGHATRAHSVGLGLMNRGHDVRFVSSLKAATYLQNIFNGALTSIFGFKLHYDQGRVQPLRTAYDVARGLTFNAVPTFKRVRDVFRDFQPNLLVTDAESFCPIVARTMKVPFVSLDNQHLLTHCVIECPRGARADYASAYAVVRGYHLGAKRYLVSTFHDAKIRYQPTTLVPPILRPEVVAACVTQEDFLLAYLGGSGNHDAMRRALESFRTIPIRAYGFGLTGKFGGVLYKAPADDEFLGDLSRCRGVISSAGHSLISECLHLKKPMLLLPFARQFEQIVNVQHVEQIGAGYGLTALSTPEITRFVDQLDKYRKALSSRPPASLEPVLDAIERELR